ncbi:MAG: F420-dependent NADP oxidoreductase [Alphaproteobacteria bacterium]|nr:F420-dependent NADP oxidoreductase [Alphaproteobacteria bacterium]
MKIGILGSGNMGRALGAAWAGCGHAIFFGGRTEASAISVAERVGRRSVGGSLARAAAFGEVLVHTARDAMPSAMVEDARALAGKVLIDLNNKPVPPGYAFEPVLESYAERYAVDVPGLRVVKAFNTLPVQVFGYAPDILRRHAVTVFAAADDADAKSIVMRLATEIGLAPVDAGPLRNARVLEGFGDMLRYLINVAKLGAATTLSARVLPPPGEA